MNAIGRRFLVVLALISGGVLLGGCTPQNLTPTLVDSIETLRVFKAEGVVPPEKMKAAKGVAVLSRVEAAVGIGGSGGEGILVERLDSGWSSPAALSVVSGTIGVQLGGREQKLVILFMNEAAIERLITDGAYSLAQAVGTGGSSTAGGGASNQSSGTEIYSRSGGLFGSAAFGGLGVSIDEARNDATYGVSGATRRILDGRVEPPPGAYTLWTVLDDLAR